MRPKRNARAKAAPTRAGQQVLRRLDAWRRSGGGVDDWSPMPVVIVAADAFGAKRRAKRA